jgi:hypothetical protein
MKGGNPDRNVRELFSEGALEKFRTLYLEPFRHWAQRLYGVQLPQKEQLNTWLALGRHHELITPLLDWTRSPYIAAFFATIDAFRVAADEHRLFIAQKHGVEAAKKDAVTFEARVMGVRGGRIFPSKPFAIWALACHRDVFVDNEFTLIDEHEFRNTRLHAQQGLFTYLTHDVHVDVESYLTSRGLGNRLEKFLIRGQEAHKALHDLNLMGINDAAMYPDLGGAARQANMSNFWIGAKTARGKSEK